MQKCFLNKIKIKLFFISKKQFSTTSSFESFYFKDLVITKSDSKKPKPDYNTPLQFGAVTTDHMLEIDHDEINGWGTPKISKYHCLEMDPCNTTFHYAIQLYEGLKVQRDFSNQDKLILFRPDLNMSRMNMSAKRICLPSFKGEELISCIEELVKLDKEWIPYKRGYSLYVRPSFISMTNVLGVLPPRQSKIFVILSPVGPYFPTGFAPIKILCNVDICRSWHGGFGASKLGANYGPSLNYYKEIQKMGFQQVLWLIDDYITEVGVMNFFVYWINKNGEKELITCPLDGNILAGVTRDSVLNLCREWNIKVTERQYTIHEVLDAVKENRILESFGTGTAAVICPIKEISYKDVSYPLVRKPDQTIGELGERLYNTLLDIQTGVIKKPSWTREFI